ncbi:DUF5011 domain-containing protein [Candidatus Borkfalkia ceftriaxoniphila]|jgi:hypothetical protein|uniref:DUF5011 domain-containing protein n=2 Tax=Candidatus Borkfalkia ceftriaxoniphila TaxID=2508949 RepID=A0A4Q2K997_9FIRM|nr:DUF5011 domain-containing protein [Candidatus Borkfalkia ceftriaxoniphila]
MDFLSFFMQIFLRDCVYKPIILCYNICNFILEVRMAKKSKAQKQVEKTVKKTHKATVVLAVLFLLIGIAAGVGASWFLTKDDTFELNGEKVIRLTVGDTYEEQGAKAISFGKDISSKVQISGDKPDLAVAGEYQIVYKVDDFRYKDYQLVRRVVVEDAGGETNG